MCERNCVPETVMIKAQEVLRLRKNFPDWKCKIKSESPASLYKRHLHGLQELEVSHAVT